LDLILFPDDVAAVPVAVAGGGGVAACQLPATLLHQDTHPPPIQQQLTLFAFTWHFVAARCPSIPLPGFSSSTHPTPSPPQIAFNSFSAITPGHMEVGKVGETTHYHTIPPHSRLLS